jgi:hypothetical protein
MVSQFFIEINYWQKKMGQYFALLTCLSKENHKNETYKGC